MTDKLIDNYDRLRGQLTSYAAVGDGAGQPDIPSILQQRRDFSVAFHAHFAAENLALAALKDVAAGTEAEPLFHEYARRAREVLLQHSALVQNWPPRKLAEQWADYCREARQHRDFFLAHLAWEEKFILPLLERLRPRPGSSNQAGSGV